MALTTHRVDAPQVPANVKTALSPRQKAVKQKILELGKRLSAGDVAQSMAAFEAAELAGLAADVAAAMAAWDGEREAVDAAALPGRSPGAFEAAGLPTGAGGVLEEEEEEGSGFDDDDDLLSGLSEEIAAAGAAGPPAARPPPPLAPAAPAPAAPPPAPPTAAPAVAAAAADPRPAAAAAGADTRTAAAAAAAAREEAAAAAAAAAARAAAIVRRDSARNFVAESVAALKAAAEADGACKKTPGDKALVMAAARGWIKAGAYVAEAIAAESTTEKVRSALGHALSPHLCAAPTAQWPNRHTASQVRAALRPKQAVAAARLAQLGARLSAAELAEAREAVAEGEAASVAGEVSAAMTEYDERQRQAGSVAVDGPAGSAAVAAPPPPPPPTPAAPPTSAVPAVAPVPAAAPPAAPLPAPAVPPAAAPTPEPAGAAATPEPPPPDPAGAAGERASARAAAAAAARSHLVEQRDGGRDFVKESVAALKAAAAAEGACKKAPGDKPLGLLAARCWIKADRYMAKALAAEKTTAKVRSALEPKQTTVTARLAQLTSKLSEEEMGLSVTAYEEDEAASVAGEVAAAMAAWDTAQDELEAAAAATAAAAAAASAAAAEAAAAAEEDFEVDDLLGGLGDDLLAVADPEEAARVAARVEARAAAERAVRGQAMDARCATHAEAFMNMRRDCPPLAAHSHSARETGVCPLVGVRMRDPWAARWRLCRALTPVSCSDGCTLVCRTGRDAGMDMVKEAVAALKAGADAEARCKQAPADAALGVAALQARDRTLLYTGTLAWRVNTAVLATDARRASPQV